MTIELAKNLVGKGLIDADRMDDALQRQVVFGGSLDTNLLELGLIEENTLVATMAEVFAMQIADAEMLKQRDQRMLKLFPPRLAERYQMLPVSMTGRVLHVLTSKRIHPVVEDEIRFMLSLSLRAHLVSEPRLQILLRDWLGIGIDSRYEALESVLLPLGRQPAKEEPASSDATRVSIEPEPVKVERVQQLVDGIEAAARKADQERDQARSAAISFEDAVDRVMRAETREEIVDTALRFARQFMPFVGLFVIHNDTIAGWDAVGMPDAHERIRQVHLGIDEPSVLQTVIQTRAQYLGPVPASGNNTELLQVLGRKTPRNALILPVMVNQRLIGLLYGDAGPRAIRGKRIASLLLFVNQLSTAFENLILHRKQRAQQAISETGLPKTVVETTPGEVAPERAPDAGKPALDEEPALDVEPPLGEEPAPQVESDESLAIDMTSEAVLLAESPAERGGLDSGLELVEQPFKSLLEDGLEEKSRTVRVAADSAPALSDSEDWDTRAAEDAELESDVGVSPAMFKALSHDPDKDEQSSPRVQLPSEIYFVGEAHPLVAEPEAGPTVDESQAILTVAEDAELSGDIDESSLEESTVKLMPALVGLPESVPLPPRRRRLFGQEDDSRPAMAQPEEPAKERPKEKTAEPQANKPEAAQVTERAAERPSSVIPRTAVSSGQTPTAEMPVRLESLEEEHGVRVTTVDTESDVIVVQDEPAFVPASAQALSRIETIRMPQDLAPPPQNDDARVVDFAGPSGGEEPELERNEFEELADDLVCGVPERMAWARSCLIDAGPEALPVVMRRFPGYLSLDVFQMREPNVDVVQHGELIRYLVDCGTDVCPLLVEQLESPDERCRYYAVRLLGRIGCANSVSRLADRLYDRSPLIRLTCVDVLHGFRNAHAFQVLLAGLRAKLRSTVAEEQAVAAALLGNFKDQDAVPLLVELVRTSNKMVARAARESLSFITKQDFGSSERKWIKWWKTYKGQSRIRWLIAGLQSKNRELRYSSFRELSQITQESFGYHYDGSKTERDQSVENWLQWWEDKGRFLHFDD